MKNNLVIIIAADHPLDGDARLRRKLANAEKRAARQSPRFPDLDLYAFQKAVHKNILKLQLLLDGRYTTLFDLMNFIINQQRFPNLTPENASEYYHFGNGFTLNGVYLYEYLHDRGYDPVVIQNYSQANLQGILQEKPLAVCISSTFIYLDDIKEIAADIKEDDPTIPVIVGGILVKKVLDAGGRLAPQTLNWLSTFSGKIDAFVVEAHGERTLAKLLKALRKGWEPATIANLALFDKEGKIFFTPREEESLSIDTTAIQWGKIPRKYLRPALSVTSSIGCYYRCRFCTYHLLFPRVQYKSLEVLREELRRIQGLGFVRHVRFADDNFTARADRLKAVLNMMIDENFDFTWSSFARANSLTPEVVKLMKASGCDLLFMGIESANQTILDNMDKKLNPKQAWEAIRLLNDWGIVSLGAFIIGYPGETRKTFYETVDFINKTGLKYYHPYLFYHSKSLLVHEEREKFGLQGLGHAWKHGTMDSVEASSLMSQMIRLIEHGFTEGKEDTWETYKLLRGEGYSSAEIYELHKLKRELHLEIEEADPRGKYTTEVQGVFDKLTRFIKKVKTW
jgi:radical SAM superfamily enzyme YgiQ (UPF0313 family)